MNNSPSASTVDHAESSASDILWTTEEVADFLRVSIKTVFNLRKTGLPYLQLGGAVRFHPQEVRDYLFKIAISPHIVSAKRRGNTPNCHDPVTLPAVRCLFRRSGWPLGRQC